MKGGRSLISLLMEQYLRMILKTVAFARHHRPQSQKTNPVELSAVTLTQAFFFVLI